MQPPALIRAILPLETLAPGRLAFLLAALAVCYALAQAALLVPVFFVPLNGTWPRTARIDLLQTASVAGTLLLAHAALRRAPITPFAFLSLARPLKLGSLVLSFLITCAAIAAGEILLRGAWWEEISWAWVREAVALIPVSILQAGNEEIIYRGLLLALLYGAALALARLLRLRASGPGARLLVGAVVLAVDAWIFAWWHGAQFIATWVSHVAIGITAGLLLWMTGRLEDAIGYHAANNYCLLVIAGPLILQRGFTGVSQLYQLFSDREPLSRTFLFYAATSGGILAARLLAASWINRPRRSSRPHGYPLPAGTPPDSPPAES